MSTPIDICNSALVKVGQEPISSFTEESKSARVLRIQYPVIRDRLIQDHYWNFAVKTENLALLPEAQIGASESRFALPQDYFQAIKLISNRFYKIESGILITDQPTALLRYVWKNFNTFSYTPLFREALAYAIASDIAYLMTQSNTVATRIEQLAKKARLDAASVDAQEDFIDNVHADDFVDSRFTEIQTHFN